MDKKIIVTGAGGFIGSALVRYLAEKKLKVEGLTSDELDVTDKLQIEKLSKKEPGHIIHLGGKTFVPRSWEAPGEFFDVNTFGTLNILEYCRKNKVSLTYISAYIYGVPKHNPIKETADINPNNPYAKSKYMAEQLCEFYAKEFNVKVSIIRPFNVYGAGQKKEFLIPHIINQVLNEASIKVMDLSPKRDYIYLEDLLEAIYMTTVSIQDYDVFNIGSGVSYSVEDVINICQEIAGTSKKIECSNVSRKNELNDVVADVSHAKEVLGWTPAHSLKEGLTNMIRESHL